MRVLVTGAGGQLGRDLTCSLSNRADVTGADHQALEVVDREAVLAAACSVRPHVIVHLAAWTAVDASEGDPGRAFRVNALGSRNVAEAAKLVGAHVCYLSTDYVFDGTARDPYHEWDEPNPQTVYGRSKLAGERELGPGATIVRTAWLSGQHGSNLVKTVLKLGASGSDLRFVDDQVGSPTFTEDLAPVVARLARECRPGVFHVTNQGHTSWYGLARAVLESAGMDAERVKPISTSELDPPRAARRPAMSVLDNAALRASGGELLPEWRESLDRLVKTLRGGSS